jgi:hypothetical protein
LASKLVFRFSSEVLHIPTIINHKSSIKLLTSKLINKLWRNSVKVNSNNSRNVLTSLGVSHLYFKRLTLKMERRWAIRIKKKMLYSFLTVQLIRSLTSKSKKWLKSLIKNTFKKFAKSFNLSSRGDSVKSLTHNKEQFCMHKKMEGNYKSTYKTIS